MSGRVLLLSIALAAFAVLTVEAIIAHGYVGFVELAMANWATRTLSADLVISLSLITWWMVVDARERGRAFLPYVLVTLTFGAAGPLLYLIRREAKVAA
jgi:hypothetical protein